MNEPDLPPLPKPAKVENWMTNPPKLAARWFSEEQLTAYATAAVIAEIERCAALCDLTPSEILLLAGEMTAQELRTVRAVLSSRVAAIRVG